MLTKQERLKSWLREARLTQPRWRAARAEAVAPPHWRPPTPRKVRLLVGDRSPPAARDESMCLVGAQPSRFAPRSNERRSRRASRVRRSSAG